MPFPDHCSEYPTKRQFVDYLQAYADRSGVEPRFNQAVTSARYDQDAGLWRVRAEDILAAKDAAAAATTEYINRWLVVATGENAKRIVPEFEGAQEFAGPVSPGLRVQRRGVPRQARPRRWMQELRHGGDAASIESRSRNRS
ncbi:unnamed protein product [Miscanthus lutarioriparius]|uniref:indole-3-pyruvate monooxygenase n=1 Tax=Miscanthus lutarioriparius TaxID=422564 RepID=A0A811QR16_9POAL|nr:unnamed protein product [Miscanthus lutarioriparius]